MKIVACPHLGRFIFPVSTSRIQKNHVARLFCSGLLVVLASACPVAHAQANFSWAQTTIGSGLQNAAGVVVDEVGNVYIADGAHNRVLKETPSGGSYIQTTVVSGLNTPVGLAVDGGGNVYTSTGGNQVVKETLSGGSYSQTVVPAV